MFLHDICLATVLLTLIYVCVAFYFLNNYVGTWKTRHGHIPEWSIQGLNGNDIYYQEVHHFLVKILYWVQHSVKSPPAHPKDFQWRHL